MPLTSYSEQEDTPHNKELSSPKGQELITLLYYSGSQGVLFEPAATVLPGNLIEK